MRFIQGTLWNSLIQTTEHALRMGAILPIPTEYEFVEDSGMRFFVRIISGLLRKDEERKKQTINTESGLKVNPFLPYEKDLFVADISETHVTILNKFNVVDHHLLIITREFEDQEMLLTLGDFEALLACMAEYEGLGFYNGGKAAGASQSHKHLQLVPLPLVPEGPAVPIETLLTTITFTEGLGTSAVLPFLHVFVSLEEVSTQQDNCCARDIFNLYRRMLRHAGLKAPSEEGPERQSQPYCFLITRRWMLLVPRSREFFEGIEINSLGFAGTLLVRSEAEMALLKQHGPMRILKEVALSPVPKP